MPDHLHVILRTERGATEPVEIRCSCDDFWSVAQQRAMEELYPRKDPVQHGVLDLRRSPARILPRHVVRYSLALVGTMPAFATAVLSSEAVQRLNRADFYAVRAKRIARAYARVFLEDFEYGNPRLLGRFYWAGLAAFASKQVACTLEHPAVAEFADSTVRALAKGNLWLYNDAWPWHFAWALCPGSVRMCSGKRDVRNLDPTVLSNFHDQEWAAQVAPCVPWHIDEATGRVGESIGQLRLAPLMEKAIRAWELIAAESNPVKRESSCMEHLWAMARHEQGEVLQGLIYSEPAFQEDLERGRMVRDNTTLDKHILLFKLQLSFSAEGYCEDPERRSEAPQGIHLHQYKERMAWIKKAAERYHQLMSGPKRPRMLAELRKLADHDA
ncbi:MAG: hypothetical protein KGJ64_10045 [Betaproteobacteria bacterium]|nr:hypothetical protein [Betaproteobacteria bacterium]